MDQPPSNPSKRFCRRNLSCPALIAFRFIEPLDVNHTDEVWVMTCRTSVFDAVTLRETVGAFDFVVARTLLNAHGYKLCANSKGER